MAAGAAIGLGGIAFRQAVNFINQKQRYMVVMAQNLYFHSMADNRGVMIKLADRAAEEDIKEEVLLYSVLAKEQAKRSDLPAIDAAIEQYLTTSFGVNVDFDLEDALGRLIADGLVAEAPDGAFPPCRRLPGCPAPRRQMGRLPGQSAGHPHHRRRPGVRRRPGEAPTTTATATV